ncbi:hypothetical protein LCGC14_1018240 [marine sediment metagenome]|uniref:Uncharacterized protein n=1 Tax=marine sediment metagenome TaxID=412755 RepID=A0A0F9NJX3_9ZZZZ
MRSSKEKPARDGEEFNIELNNAKMIIADQDAQIRDLQNERDESVRVAQKYQEICRRRWERNNRLQAKVKELEEEVRVDDLEATGMEKQIQSLEGKIIDLVGKLEKDPAFECGVCEAEYSADECVICKKCYLGEETARRYKSLQAENERLRKAAVHFEQKAAASQGTIDRIKSNFKAALEEKQ